MLSVTWINPYACAIEIGCDGISTKLLCVSDDVRAAKEEIRGDFHTILLCGPTCLAIDYSRYRVLASEPIARLLYHTIERCQIEERVKISENVIVTPHYSGGSFGCADWVILVKNKKLITFCGMKGRDCPAPPKSKFLILAREPIVKSLHSPSSSQHSTNSNASCLVVVKEPIISRLPLVWSCGGNYDCLPVKCFQTKSIFEKYEPSWGKLPRSTGKSNNIYVLEEELNLVLSVAAKHIPVKYDMFDDLGWTEVEARQVLKNHGNLILGPKWEDYDNLHQSITSSFRLLKTQQTGIFEGENTMDRVVELLLHERVKDLTLHGLKFEFNDSKDFVEMLGKKDFRMSCTSSADLQKKLLHELLNLDKRLTIKDGATRLLTGEIHNKKRENTSMLSSEQERKRHRFEEEAQKREKMEKDESERKIMEEKRKSIEREEKQEKELKEREIRRLDEERAIEEKHRKLIEEKQQKEELKKSTETDDKKLKLIQMLKAKHGKMLLTDLAKEKEFGGKPDIMRFVELHSKDFDVKQDDTNGKRVIVLRQN